MFQQEKKDLEDYRYRVATGEYTTDGESKIRKTIKKSAYFSDEEESE